MPVGADQNLMVGRGGRVPSRRFRASFTTPEGLGKTDIFMGHVTNVDVVNHTVDVVSQFDQIRVLAIPTGSPYQHSNRGDGLTVVPEVGAKCAVCWPGDSSPPFVLAFIMPHETIPDASTSAEDPSGTGSHGSTNQSPTAASYAGGRPIGKPGDMYMRGRDGQFVVLHRGGVLQIGSNELAQRIYVPLNNLVMDVAENYVMHNSGGTVRWGIQDGEGESKLPAEFKQTFRVYANEKYADVRVAVGRVHDPVPETDDDGLVDQQFAEVGKSEPVVYELTLARNGFNAEDNSQAPNAANLVKLRFVFDRSGNAFMRMDGNVGILCKKKLRLRVKEEMEISADDTFRLTVASDARVQVGGNLEITAAVTRFNGGDKPAAFVGSQVAVTLPLGLLIAIPGPPGFAPLPPGLNTAIGTVTSGRSELLI
jgi:hypothetical protein